MDYTGERCIPGKKGLEILELEHRARYACAAESVAGKRVLDLGSGAGYGSAMLGERAEYVLGFDISKEAVRYAKGAYSASNVDFHIGNVCAPGFVNKVQKLAKEPFDCVTCFEVIEHVAEPLTLLAHVKSLLRPEGVFFISTPNIDYPYESGHDNPHHVTEYSLEEFEKLLSARFENIVIAEQQVHLLSSIGFRKDESQPLDEWRNYRGGDAKYFVAACSDVAKSLPELNKLLVTSDANVRLLQERLRETRQDQAFKGQRIALLDRHIKDLQSTGLEAEVAASRIANEKAQAELLYLRERDSKNRDEYQAQVKQLEARHAEAQAELESLRERDSKNRDEYQAQVKQLEARHAEAISEAQIRAQELERAQAELESLRERDSKNRDEYQAQVKQLEERHAEAQAELESLRERDSKNRDEYQAQVKQLEARHAEAISEAQIRAQELERAQAELESLRERSSRDLHAKESEVNALEEERRANQVAVAKAHSRNAQLDAKVIQLEDRLRVTREKIGNIENEIQGARRETNLADALLQRMYRQFERANAHWWWRLGLKLRSLPAAVGIMTKSPRFGFDEATRIIEERTGRKINPNRSSSPAYARYQSLLEQEAGQREMTLATETDIRAVRKDLLEMPETALVSIVMPTYNRAELLGNALNSVLNQSYKNWECLVIDDGSTDNTEEVVRGYSERHDGIRLIRASHGGVSAARDKGLKNARGKYIAYLDSDNEWLPDYLLFTVHALEATGQLCSYSAMNIIDRDAGEEHIRARSFNHTELLKNNFIDINVFAHDRKLYESLGGFDVQLRRWVDWDLILRYTRRHKPTLIPIVLCDYFRNKKINQITHEEPHAFKFKVLSKHLVSWHQLEAEASLRTHGLVSIIIPVFDQLQVTEDCVASILDHTHDPAFEIILVDNGSHEETAKGLERLAEAHPDVCVVRNYENYMFALGNNTGVPATHGEYIVFLNNDTLVTEGWLAELIRPFAEDDSVGLVGPKLTYMDNTIQAAGIVFNEQSKIPYHIYQHEPADAPYVNKERTYQAMTGACMALKAEDVLALRGFDARYVNGAEDIDLCMRIQHVLGKKVLYNPKSHVYHLEGKTPGRGKAIGYNRETFVELWGSKVRPDDQDYYREDGFRSVRYEKPGTEPDGDTALYKPVLESSNGAPAKSVATKWEAPAASARVESAPALARKQRILVVKPSGIGNMVMFTPALAALREQMPNAHITVVCYAAEGSVIEDQVDRVIRLERKDPDTGAVDTSEVDENVRTGEYDIAIYPPFTNLGRPTPHLLNAIPRHITHPRVDFEHRHEVLHNLDIVEILGWHGEAPDMQMSYDADAPKKFGLSDRIVGVHCGASASAHMQKKKWPVEHWANLLDRIPEDYTIVFCGGAGESDDVSAVLELMAVRRPASTLSLVGRMNLAETAGVIRASKLFITNDSGLMHIACAQKTPVIALFGPTLPTKNGPWGSSGLHTVMSVDVPCGPCYYGTPERLMACDDQICLKNLTPERVYEAVAERLKLAPSDTIAPKVLPIRSATERIR